MFIYRKCMKKPSIGHKFYKQGYYKITNIQKYKGNVADVQFRSSWELVLMRWLDHNPAVLAWNSEETIIPYISPIDNRQHRYFIDFTAIIVDKNGVTQKFLIEVKPHAETKAPRKQKNYQKKLATYLVNQSKWKYAEMFAKKIGAKFIILTEREIFQ